MPTTKQVSVEAEQLPPGAPLEDEVYEGVVHGGALGEEARQQGDQRRDVLPGAEHAPEADGHVGGPREKEPRADHRSHLQQESSEGDQRTEGGK